MTNKQKIIILQAFLTLSCLVTIVMAEGQLGLGGFGGYGGPPVAPYGRPIGGLGGAYGGLGGGPGAFGPGAIGGFGPAPLGGPIGGLGPRPFGPGAYGGGLGGFGGAPGAFGQAPLGGGFGGLGPSPIGPVAGLYAPSNYQFGYGVQTGDYNGAATFGANEEHNAYGTIGNYHVNTPGSYQTVNYNIPH